MTLRQKLACVGLTVFGLQIASAAAGGAPLADTKSSDSPALSRIITSASCAPRSRSGPTSELSAILP